MNTSGEGQERRAGVGGLFLRIALCVIIGIPLVAVVWESLNELLAGQWNARLFLLALPALVLLIVFWRFMARAVERWGLP